ncbi:MAG: flavin reductase family protein [Ignavibacteriales bacterium]|nr:flavin reductase family protein [Ignavibacteriales bacterium]
MNNKEPLSLSPSEMEPASAYKLFQSLVAPRPIAWVSSIDTRGRVNLAPFSFFNAIATKPLIVMLAIGRKGALPKDTLRNIEETGEFVINIVSEELAEAMNITSGDWPSEINEFEILQLPSQPSVDVKPPRVADAPAAMEAKVTQIIPVQGTSSTLVLAEVIRFHLREGILRPNGLVDPLLSKPVARLGDNEYATIGKVFTMNRPKF